MRKFIIFTGLAFFLAFPVFSLTAGASQNESTNAVIKILNEKGIDYEVRPLLQDYGGFDSSVHVYIRPKALHTAGTFVLAVPVNSAFSVETALTFIDAAKADGRANTDLANVLLVAFLGDEKTILGADSGNPHKGLRDLASLPDMPGTWAVCYLDIDSAPDALQIRHGAGEYLAPLDLVRPLPVLFEKYGVPASFHARFNELYRLGLIRTGGELSMLYANEMYGISLFPVYRQSDREKQKPAQLAAMLLEYAGNMELPLQSIDQHYTLLSLPGRTFFISEQTTIIFLLSGFALLFIMLLVFSGIYRVVLISRLFLFLKKGWIFFIFLPLMMINIILAGYVYGFLHTLLKIRIPTVDIWGLVLILFVAVQFYIILSHLLDYFNFPRKAQFYGVCAIITAAIGLVFAAILDLTYTVSLLWVFILSFIGGTNKKPAVVYVSALLIPLRILDLFFNIREAGGLSVGMFIQGSGGSASNWIIAFSLAVLFLPVLLLLKRGMFMRHAKKNIPQHHIIANVNAPKSLVLRLGIFGFLLAVMAVNTIFFSGKPLEISRTAEIPGSFTVTVTETVFQESLIVNVTLKSAADPVVFDLYLTSEEDELPLIYSAPAPVERQSDNSIRFILGENPPNPLTMEIVLRNRYRGAFRARAIYNEWDPRMDPEPKPRVPDDSKVDYLLTVQTAPVFLTR